jgi:hypothetical protein
VFDYSPGLNAVHLVNGSLDPPHIDREARLIDRVSISLLEPRAKVEAFV